jgi:hypothetical protein
MLMERYKNQLPLGKVDDFELGRLIGQQDVISYILTITQADIDEEQLKEK